MTDDITLIVPAVTAVVSAALAFGGTLHAQSRQRETDANAETARWERTRRAQRSDWLRDQTLIAVSEFHEVAYRVTNTTAEYRVSFVAHRADSNDEDVSAGALKSENEILSRLVPLFEKLSELESTVVLLVSQDTADATSAWRSTLFDCYHKARSAEEEYEAASTSRAEAKYDYMKAARRELGIGLSEP